MSPARRSLLHVNGGRILQIYVVAQSRASAVIWKTIVHLGGDMLLIVGVILAGLGAALCNEGTSRPSSCCGPPSTSPSPASGGSVAPGCAHPSSPSLQYSQPSSLPAPGSARARRARCRARHWHPRGYRGSAAIAGKSLLVAGLWHGVAVGLEPAVRDIYCRGGPQLTGVRRPRRARRHFQAQFPTRLQVRVGGVHVNDVALAAGETTTIRTMWPARGLAYIELDQQAPANEPAVIAVTVPGR